MSRSGYTYDCEDYGNWSSIRWRGQVASAIRGKRGQSFLRELVESLDAMPVKRLIKDDLQNVESGEVCAIGAVGLKRGVDMAALDPEDPQTISDKFGIAYQLVQEIEYLNDENYDSETPESRWEKMRAWAVSELKQAL